MNRSLLKPMLFDYGDLPKATWAVDVRLTDRAISFKPGPPCRPLIKLSSAQDHPGPLRARPSPAVSAKPPLNCYFFFRADRI